MTGNETLQVGYESRFIMVNYNAVMGGQLKAYEIAVYVVLCAFASRTEKTCFPSYATLAAKAGCSRCTAIRAVAHLEKLGFIIKHGQKSTKGDPTSNRYLIRAVATEPVMTEDEAVDGAVEKPPEIKGVVSDSNHPSLPQIPPVVSDKYQGGIRDRHELNVFNYNKPLNQNHSIYPPPAGAESDGLKEAIEYKYFEDNMPDKLPFIDGLMAAIRALQKEDALENRRLLIDINSYIVLEFMEDMKSKTYQQYGTIQRGLKRCLSTFYGGGTQHLQASYSFQRVGVSPLWELKKKTSEPSVRYVPAIVESVPRYIAKIMA